MRVLIACEESQTVCKAFRERGHEAYSCDILDCSGGHPEWHIKDNALFVVKELRWDMVIAHPPCTYMANSGVRWLGKFDLNPDRWAKLAMAMEFFNAFRPFCEKLAIENPIPHKYARNGFTPQDKETGESMTIEGIGRYTQLIQPWQFGHGEQKATCLWLYGLPKLKPTNIVGGREQRIWKMTPGPERSKERSKTFPGIARAMAEQWGLPTAMKG